MHQPEFTHAFQSDKIPLFLGDLQHSPIVVHADHSMPAFNRHRDGGASGSYGQFQNVFSRSLRKMPEEHRHIALQNLVAIVFRVVIFGNRTVAARHASPIARAMTSKSPPVDTRVHSGAKLFLCSSRVNASIDTCRRPGMYHRPLYSTASGKSCGFSCTGAIAIPLLASKIQSL